MRQAGTDRSSQSDWAQCIFVKSETVRIFNPADSTLAVELNSGKSLLFTPLEKAIYMACNGLDNCALIIDKLGLNRDYGYQIFEKLFQSGFIKVTKRAIASHLAFPELGAHNSASIDNCGVEVTFDAAELTDDCWEEAQETWFKKGCAYFCQFASAEASVGEAKPLFRFKHVSWSKHSEFIDNLLECWQQDCSCQVSENSNIEKFNHQFQIILETEEIPKGADFVNYCQGCASASRLCTWDRLSALGKLWCKLHTLNATIIWRFPFDVLLDKRNSAFSACFREKPIVAPRLAEAAEIAAMLFDTAGKNFGLPKGHCGCFPMAGISILPVVQIEVAEQLEQIWPLFTQSGCSAFGFSLAEELLIESSAKLENALIKGLEFCFSDSRFHTNLTVFPFTRWLQDLEGYVPRCESGQAALQRCQGRAWLKNKCRRCLNWHFCASSNSSYPPLPCKFISKWAPEFLCRTVKAYTSEVNYPSPKGDGLLRS